MMRSLPAVATNALVQAQLIRGANQSRSMSTGMKPKAGDYEIAVKKVLSEAIPRYRGYLSMSAPYPGPME